MSTSYTLAKSIFFEKADFEFLFKTGRKKFGSFFAVHYRFLDPNESTTKRLGLVASKRAAGNNVRRNLIKRLIRETYRLHQHELQSLQLLVVAKRDLKGATREMLRADLEKLWEYFSEQTRV